MKKSQLLNFFRVTLLLLIFSAFSSSALAATITGGTKLYLKPNSNWSQANARFAVYLFTDGGAAKWYSMSDGDADGIYSTEVQAGESYEKLIFCRMNPSSGNNEWGNRWNSTCDLTYDGTNNYYNMSSSTNWGKGNNDDNCEDLTDNNKWSTYSAGGSGDIGEDCTTTTIYFKNTVGWSSVYAYLYNASYWDSSNGSGSNGIKAGPLEMKSCDGIGGKDAIYSCTYSAGHSGYISFTEAMQENFNNFNETKAAYRGDLCGTTGNMFVPSTTSSGTYNNGKTTYYNNGSWEIYDGECSGGESGDDSGDTDDGECKTLYLKPTSNWDKDGARYVAYFFKDGVGHTWMNMEKSSTCSDIYKVAVPDIDLTNVIFVRMNGKKLANTWDSKWNQTSNLTFSGSNNLYTITNIDGDGYWGSSSCTDKAECYTCKLNNFDETNLEAVKCDPNNTKIIFRETFTFTDDQVDNADKSRIEYSVSNEKYSASIPSYFAMTTPCSAIKDGGYYAMVLNPYYAGWGEVGHGDVDSDCNASGHRWFREMKGGHSPVLDSSISASKDGMLLFNCKDGTDKCIPDILYECVVNDICPNTYINFSAYITRANTNASAEKKILAEFRLLNPENNKVLAVREVKNVELTEEWNEISAMFNSSDATKVKIQLINKAESGTGNDILLDDITFSVCNPQAALVFSGTTSSTSSISVGESKTLDASITSGLMTDSWYIWQSSTDNVNWSNISTTPVQVDVNSSAKLTVKPSAATYYRAIVANSQAEAQKILQDHDPSACGMYAITNIATLDVTINNLELTSAITDDDICVDGVDATTLTLTVKNPRLVAVTDVEIKLENITDLNITKKSGTGSYSSGKWSVGDDIPAGESVSIELNITSSVSAVTSKVIQSYVSSVDGTETYDSYLKAPEESKAESTLKLNPLPAPPTVTEYKECATTGELYLYDLVDVSDKSGLIFYKTETSTTSIDTEISKKNTGINNDYYFTYEEEGKCVSKRGKVHVTILPKPEAKITSGSSQTFCAAENYTFSISAEAKNGTGIWSVTSDNARIANVNSASTTAVVKAGETATLKWTVANEKCDSSATTTLQVDKLPTITIVADKGSQTVCSTSEFTVAVDDFTGSGIWEILSETSSETNAIIGKPNEKETLVTGIESGEEVELQYTANNGECKSIKSEVVTLKNLVCNNFSLTNTFNDDDKEICLNGQTSLTISITNNSQATSTNIITSIKLPTGLTYESHSSGANYDNTTGLWTIASLGTEDENKKAELTINVKGSSVGSHTVNAIIKEATNTVVEGMEIPSTIKVNALPTANFKELSSEVCVNPKGTTQVEVEFTGASDFTLEYKLGDDTYTTDPVSSPYVIQKEISADATITLISVKDNNGCKNTSTESHNVDAISPAVITIPVPDDICAGDSLTLSAPTITENGSNVTDGKWYLGGEVYTRNTAVEYDKNNAILQYIANSSCGGEVRSNEVNITVNSAPSITINADGNLPADICAGQKYQLPSVTVTNNGSGVTSEGWYLGGNKITLDEGKYYTFSLEEDNDKSLVYKAVNGCGETTEEFESNLVVKDCANFTITYSLDKKQVCKGDEVVLTATITNNSDSNLRDVILSQSWDGSQIASKDAAGTNKKIFVTSGDVSSEYDEDNNIWKIGTFTALKSAILTITFSAQADESFHIYMKESNDVTYQDDAKNPTSKTDDLEVLEISNPVALDATKNYNGICPETSSETSSKTVNLSDLVTRNATDTLHFYDKDKILLTSEPIFDISTEIPSTVYYINRTEAGKCISNNPIPVTIEVYKPVTTSIAATKNTICSGTESDVNITVDGTAGFTIVYNNGVNDITKPISGKTLNIAETLTSTTTYKLISVTDAHECEAKLDGTESVTITVNALPELVSFDIEDSDKIICDGESTKLKATFTGKAPFKFYINDVETESEDAEWSMDITEGKTYVIKQLSDNNNCESELTQEDVTLTVESSPVVELDATNVTLNCNNPKAIITASGANSYNWSYTDQDGVEQTQTGDKLNVQLSESGQVNSSTTYIVYGYSEKAKCKSASPVTVTVTENKRTPVVSDLVSVNSQDETIEGYKETQIINCKDTELFIKSTIVDNVAAGYSPDDLTYDWAISEDGDLYEAYGVGETISAKTQGIFRLIVTDNETGCSSAAKRIEITENKTTPVITVVESVTTKDPSASEAVKTSVLTCEYPVLYLTPTIESENEVSYLWNNESTEDYLEVSEAGTYTLVVTDNVSFCSTEEYTYIVTQDNTAPTFNVDATYYLCPSDVVTEKTLSSLLPATPGVTYKFYNEAGEEIKDLYEISADASVTEYYVTGISDNGCESTKTMFSVDFARNVDFTLTTSQTSMMIGGNETVVTVVPDANSDIADTYTWLANGNELPADGLEYSTNLYLDTKFEVTATNRCDSKSQEAFVEVLWPTAFTPHNANGKNDDFAKGMHIIVFNRFYTKIFEGPDGWDGSINGTMNESESIAVPGVYYYSVQLPNGEVKKGTIEIVR